MEKNLQDPRFGYKNRSCYLYKGIYFRSSWEVNLAKYLDKNSIKYSYEEYTEIIKELLEYHDKEIKVQVKFKDNKAKDFKIYTPSIAAAYNDDRLNDLELLGWGLHNSWPIN